MFFIFPISEMIKLLLSVLAGKVKLPTGQEYKLELLVAFPWHCCSQMLVWNSS